MQNLSEVKQLKQHFARNSPFTRSEAQHALDSSALKVRPPLSGGKFAVRMRNY